MAVSNTSYRYETGTKIFIRPYTVPVLVSSTFLNDSPEAIPLSCLISRFPISLYQIHQKRLYRSCTFLCFRGYAVHVMLLTSLGFSFSFSLLYLPDVFPCLQTLYFISAIFVLSGFFAAGAFVPAYLVYEKISQINGFTNLSQIKLLVATWCNNLYAIGALIGSLALSGPVYEAYGFNFTSLVISIVMLLCTILCIFCVHNMGLFKLIFYLDDEDSLSNDVMQSSSNQDADELRICADGDKNEDQMFSPVSSLDGAPNSNKSILSRGCEVVHLAANDNNDVEI